MRHESADDKISYRVENRENRITAIVTKQAGCSIGHQENDTWKPYKSRFLGFSPDNHILIELPEGLTSSFKPKEICTISFRIGHRKCMCYVEVVNQNETSVFVKWPIKVLSVSRYMCSTNEGWHDKGNHVKFWLGGRKASDRDALYGVSKNLSVVGMMFEVDKVPMGISAGTPIGCSFCAGQATLKLDADVIRVDEQTTPRISIRFNGIERDEYDLENLVREVDHNQSISRKIKKSIK